MNELIVCVFIAICFLLKRFKAASAKEHAVARLRYLNHHIIILSYFIIIYRRSCRFIETHIILNRVVNVLKIWLEKNSVVFIKKEKLKARLIDFANTSMISANMGNAANTLKSLLERTVSC